MSAHLFQKYVTPMLSVPTLMGVSSALVIVVLLAMDPSVMVFPCYWCQVLRVILLCVNYRPE